MSKDEQRRANRRVALVVCGGMAILAAMAVVFTFATTEFRRQSDTMRPDMPSFGRSMVISVVVFGSAVGLLAGVAKWFNRPQE